jgi:hypothetical protein
VGCHPVAVHIYTQIKNITTQITTQQHKITTNVEECGPCHFFASFTLAFALQLRKKHGKTSVRVRKTCQSKKNLSQVKKNHSQSTVYILPKHAHKFTHSCKPLYMYQTVFPSIIRSSRLHIQQQTYVKQLLLPAASSW